jgi:hypothetical protein
MLGKGWRKRISNCGRSLAELDDLATSMTKKAAEKK